MDKCPCSSTKSYTECCGPVIDGSKPPATAEILMRARYTAYATGNVKFIKDTTHPKAVSDFDEASAKSWSKSSTWHGLDIISTEKGGIDDTEGVVEFVASYTQNGKEERHHERATFKKAADKWFFEDGEIIAPEPYIRETPKVGRNDPCPCNSGKKYKKCCGKS